MNGTTALVYSPNRCRVWIKVQTAIPFRATSGVFDLERLIFIIIIIIIIIKQENDYSDVRQLIAVAMALYKIKLKT